MYNIQLTNWRLKLLLYIICVFEVIITPVIIVFHYIIDFGPNILAKADVPNHYKMEHYLMVDSWLFKINFLLDGATKNESFIKVKIGTDKKHCKKYIEFVKSNKYQEIMFNSFLFDFRIHDLLKGTNQRETYISNDDKLYILIK